MFQTLTQGTGLAVGFHSEERGFVDDSALESGTVGADPRRDERTDLHPERRLLHVLSSIRDVHCVRALKGSTRMCSVTTNENVRFSVFCRTLGLTPTPVLVLRYSPALWEHRRTRTCGHPAS